MSKKRSVKKAIESISSGDARGLRYHINEALVEKVKKALNNKEKQIAKNLIESATKTYTIHEAKLTSQQIKSKKEELKKLSASLDKIFATGNKEAYGKALKRAVDLIDELEDAGIM